MIYFKFNEKSYQCAETNKKKTLLGRILHSVAMFFAANPDFEDKIESVTQWFVEYDNDAYNVVMCEIGLDNKGEMKHLLGKTVSNRDKFD